MRKHRTPEQWQALVDQQRVSGLSAPQFCKQENIGYASFCNWRKRLSDPSTDDSAGSGEASFLDLVINGHVAILRSGLEHCAQPG